MNGYQRAPLVLDDWKPEELHGLVVRARRLTVAESRFFLEGPGEQTHAERDRAVEEILASAIRSWNYQDEDGVSVEPTAENLDNRVDPVVVSELTEELVRRSNRVAPPLPKPSDGGSPSEEEFKLMADLSSDPPSSPGPS